MVTPSGNDKIGLYTNQYVGTPLSSLNDTSYGTYLDSAGSTTSAITMPTVQAQIGNATGTDGASSVGFTTLVFEPIYCYGNDAPQFDMWQNWDADHPVETGPTGGCWWSTNPIKGLPDRDRWSSLADIEANNRNATIGFIGHPTSARRVCA